MPRSVFQYKKLALRSHFQACLTRAIYAYLVLNTYTLPVMLENKNLM